MHAQPGITQPPSTTSVWDDFRREMPVCDQWSYLDHAAIGPLPRRSISAINQWGQEASQSGDFHWPQWAEQIEVLRRQSAELIGADTSEIAIVPNTTFGIAIAAEGFPWKAGDNVVIPDGEFPSNVYPWMNLQSRGIELRTVPLVDGRVCLDAIDRACDSRTQIVAMSWVGYSNGFRIDPAAAAEVAHQHGALFSLDAIQGLGVFPLDVNTAKIDFLSADGHKWMLGPEGVGFAYVRREHLDRLRPLSVGWRSVAQGEDFGHVEMNLHPTAARFELGTFNSVGCIALSKSLELLTEYGAGPQHSAIADRVLDLSEYLCGRLPEIDAQTKCDRSAPHASGIVSFQLPGFDSEAIRTLLLDGGVITSCRNDKLRVALHGFNNHDDIDRMITLLKNR